MVVIIKQLIPEIGVEVERIMKDKLEMRLLLLNHLAHVPVELHQHIEI